MRLCLRVILLGASLRQLWDKKYSLRPRLGITTDFFQFDIVSSVTVARITNQPPTSVDAAPFVDIHHCFYPRIYSLGLVPGECAVYRHLNPEMIIKIR